MMEGRGNGKFFTVVSRLADMVLLGLVFLLTSLPVLTLGTSCTALYYAVAKSVRFEEGKLFREYFRSWRENLRQGCIATAIYLLFAGMLVCALLLSDGQLTVWAAAFSGLLLLASFLYYFPVLSRFTVTVRQGFQISLFLAVHYFVKTLMMLVTLALCTVVFCIIPFLLPLLLSCYVFYMTFFIERIFREYMNISEEDAGRWYTRENQGAR